MESFDELRIGLFGVGLETYWSQFAGLEARLHCYVEEVARRLCGEGRRVVNLGLVDSPEKAIAAGHAARREDVDMLVLYVTTYALSSTVLPVVRRAGVPVLVLNLQPHAAIDYAQFNAIDDRTRMTGEWLAYCSACPAPEVANVFARARIPFRQVTGVLEDDPECRREIEEWMQAAQVRHTLEHCRMGLMGHYYSGMLDIATDLTRLCAIFGIHVEMLEVDELSGIRPLLADEVIEAKKAEITAGFDVQPDCTDGELLRAASTAAALDAFVGRRQLSALAYYYKGSGVPANEDTMSSIILGASMLTRRGIPVAGEYEIKNALAMKIMDAFGAGGSFTEYYAVDFRDDVVLMGHDGPGHTGIAEGRAKVRPLGVYHGKVGSGLSVEMMVRHGPVTLLSVAEDETRGFKLIVAEGESVAGPILEIGNTNSRYRFPVGARRFIEAWNAEGPAHHCVVGVDHVSRKIEKLANLLDIGFAQVC